MRLLRILGGAPSRRRTRHEAPMWSDSMSGRVGATADGRYMCIPEIDRWRSVPFAMTPAPDRGDVMLRVRQHVEALEESLDEGSGPALDLLIESWAAAWLAGVDAEYQDHVSVIDVHLGQARQWLREAQSRLEFAESRWKQLQGIHADAERRLTAKETVNG